MTRPIEALIHTDALAHNLARARVAAPGAKVWAVVKANAYGHGIAAVYDGLRGADGFALLDIVEAEQIRALGWRGPILLLEGCFDARDLDACSRLSLWHVVHRREQIDWLAAHKTHAPHSVYLKLNSGMNRLGFAPAAYRAAWLRLDALPQVAAITTMTHLAAADEHADASEAGTHADEGGPAEHVPELSRQGSGASNRTSDRPFLPRGGEPPEEGDEGGLVDKGRRPEGRPRVALPPSVADQLDAFEAACSGLPGERSLCNSAAALRFGATHREICGDWIRPGIMLYGSAPDHPHRRSSDWQLEPTMSLRSELIAVQSIDAGTTVGYGGAFRAEQAMRIGVVACGYADGYPRVAPCSNERSTPVLVDGVETRIVGRVSMDMITVDLGPVPEARVGSEVTLWGRAGSGAVLPIDIIAQAAGTLGYELMCARAPRVATRVVA